MISTGIGKIRRHDMDRDRRRGLRRRHHVRVPERHRDWAGKVVAHLLQGCPLGRELGQRVLDHPELDIRLPELGPKIADLGNRKTTVVGQHDDLGRPQLLRDLADLLFLQGPFGNLRHKKFLFTAPGAA